jgi:N-acyl-D-amino-acid deacylase
MGFDLVVRNGTVVDGSGAERYQADVGVKDGRITSIGTITEKGAQEIDAEGHYVTPGFIDMHTHLDAQIIWDPFGPAASHGVTSTVMGNCGIAVAPCHDAEERDLFVMRALAIAEDIAPDVVNAAVDWDRWETFPEYLDYLRTLPKGINFGAQVGHGALRTYVMGERAFEPQGATDDDIKAMAQELERSMRAGAIGFSSIRTGLDLTAEQARKADPRVVNNQASTAEMRALGEVLARVDLGALQMPVGADRRMWDEEAIPMSIQTGRAIQVVYGLQPLPGDEGLPSVFGVQPEAWLKAHHFEEANAQGAQLVGAIGPRTFATLLGFRVHTPWDDYPMWKELRERPYEEQRAALSDPDRRAQLAEISKRPPSKEWMAASPRMPVWDQIGIMDRTLPPYPTVAEVAAARGVDPFDLFVDLSLESDFHQLFWQPISALHTRDNWLAMLKDPNLALGLADTGAHTAQSLDWNAPTYLLGYWVREDQGLTWEEGVRMLTGRLADVWQGLGDRGYVQEGKVADLAIFDPETIAPAIPDADTGLPSGAKRLTCEAIGVKATVVGGEILFRDGEHTGAYPGRLLEPVPR